MISEDNHGPVGLPILAAPKWLGGVIYGLVGQNHLVDIENCAHDAYDLGPELWNALVDLRQGNINDAIDELFDVIAFAPLVFRDCESMGPDVMAIVEWTQIFKDKKKLASTVTRHYLLHKKEADADIAEESELWDAGFYFWSGVDSAKILTLLVGPIEMTESMLQ